MKPYILCLDNISKNFSINNMKKTGSKWVLKVFPVDDNAVNTNDILDIHIYLMKEIWYKKKFGFA